jgi:LysR family transcriptional regulator, transcription activator of glutamate synthase operon
MEIKQVQYFLMLSEMGSFSAAAEELYISQSSLSKQIIALEKELNSQLFDRSKRKIALTPAGEAFLIHAKNLNTAYQDMLAKMAQYKTTTSLSIVAIPVIAQYGITSYIAQFKQAHPNIQFTLDEREATAILPLLNNHQFDLAFLRDNYLDREQYAFLEVARDQFQVILSRHHRLAGRESIALKELSDENFIMFDKGTIVHELAVDACRANGFEPRIFYASLRVESVLGLVASNSGVALMMEKVFSYHQHPDVIAIPLKESIASNLVLARLKNTKESRAARTFFNFMEKTLAD